MKIPSSVLIILSIVVLFIFGLLLISSFQQQQIQSDLELYQANFVLQASEYKFKYFEPEKVNYVRESLFGKNPYETTEKQYQEAIKENIKFRETLKEDTEKNTQIIVAKKEPEKEIQENLENTERLYLNLGLLQSKEGKTSDSLKSWQQILQSKKYGKLAQGLVSLKGSSAVDGQELEREIKKDLQGWFRYSGLNYLYQQQNEQEKLELLEVEEQKNAGNAVVKLLFISILPIIGIILGMSIAIFFIVQWVTKGKEALLSPANNFTWEIPWTWETVLQVFVVGFFLLSQGIVYLVLPVVLQLFNTKALDDNLLFQALKIFIIYVLMSAAGLGFLYLSIKPFFPLGKDWFKFDLAGNWFLQGVGGYLVALPLVVVISLVNQQIWQGQGGSNPLLFLAIEANNGWVVLIFFITACLAAPFYEEILFRGFLLPSLTAYFPAWGAIILSGFLFALAHLNLSEVLPLTTLGIILGFVYQRSRNLYSSMLLHSLWNTGTLLSLFLLASGG